MIRVGSIKFLRVTSQPTCASVRSHNANVSWPPPRFTIRSTFPPRTTTNASTSTPHHRIENHTNFVKRKKTRRVSASTNILRMDDFETYDSRSLFSSNAPDPNKPRVINTVSSIVSPRNNRRCVHVAVWCRLPRKPRYDRVKT